MYIYTPTSFYAFTHPQAICQSLQPSIHQYISTPVHQSLCSILIFVVRSWTVNTEHGIIKIELFSLVGCVIKPITIWYLLYITVCSNPDVVEHVLSSSLLSTISSLLDSYASGGAVTQSLASRLMYTLSSVLRSHPDASLKFILKDGMEMLRWVRSHD